MANASTIFRKGDDVVYTSGHGNEFKAIILTAHRSGGAKVRVQFSIRGDVLIPGFHGETYEVGDSQLSFRTREGIPICRIRFGPVTPHLSSVPV